MSEARPEVQTTDASSASPAGPSEVEPHNGSLSSKDKSTTVGEPRGAPLLTFGIISDIQYANIPDGSSHRGVPRYYRAALDSMDRAVSGWLERGAAFGMHLGDILDGYHPKDESDAALTELLRRFSRLNKPVYHMLGNHCLYNLPRPVLNERLRMGGPDTASYYALQPHPDWRFLVLDGYDISLLGWPPEHPNHQLAQQILREQNPNEEKNSPEGLKGTERRFVKFGGGLSNEQLAWMRHELAEAAGQGQRALVFCHLPIHPNSGPPASLMWNFQEAMSVIEESGCVAGVFSGHAHQDGFGKDGKGTQYRVLNGVIETPPGTQKICHMNPQRFAEPQIWGEAALCMATKDLGGPAHARHYDIAG
ncbi:hypothetical protein WJX84_000667 [Apatococcus fuscideae]|uniref:Calcineurin-like phosphoesterase domain-containing protein n=1 Tax=Apatococcus fuscideae TaxID=2026836 RepID=A0AAW1SJG5_9CHLO